MLRKKTQSINQTISRSIVKKFTSYRLYKLFMSMYASRPTVYEVFNLIKGVGGCLDFTHFANSTFLNLDLVFHDSVVNILQPDKSYNLCHVRRSRAFLHDGVQTYDSVQFTVDRLWCEHSLIPAPSNGFLLPISAGTGPKRLDWELGFWTWIVSAFSTYINFLHTALKSMSRPIVWMHMKQPIQPDTRNSSQTEMLTAGNFPYALLQSMVWLTKLRHWWFILY